ncbi:E3 ubiquitin-protein ligase ZFP91 isoform X1 [Oreochromis niloticus]|uniref:E3 ubiquitin-protein ligase ZFP91 n=1 Tax=Oreochromis niloticus TaxID=8128 RepID=A0A669AZ53_ORENI|nr:E3 ubiquitin-protein ligase ZFP91 isoform X1 [Oreochromis niloticus]
MESGKDEVSDTGPKTRTPADSTAASKASADSTERSCGRAGSKRRTKTAFSSPDSDESRSVTSGSVRVLRPRGAGAGSTCESRNIACKKKATSPRDARSRPAGSRTRNTPVMQSAIKKPTTSRAATKTLGPKLPKTRKGGRKPSTRASHTLSAATCKPKAESGAFSCVKYTGSVKESDGSVADPDVALKEDLALRDDQNDLVKTETKTNKSKRHTTSQHKELKKEESEKEEEDCGIKKEETTRNVAQGQDGVIGTDPEPVRKRGKRDDRSPRQPKRRKKPPVQYVRCEIEGCGTVLAHPRYLQHHIKYQHLLKKKYVCDHPSCGRLFRLQKQLLRHAKHHTDQRDFICEYCARAFKSSHNLAVHRMIHTGEKPIQCEICGFTCRQKASLNWHMKKHDAEASYQFSCSICGKKFEKKDSVVAHKAKTHPEVLIAEALAANGGEVISTPTPVLQTLPAVIQSEQPSFSQESCSVISTTTPVLETTPLLTKPVQPSVSQQSHKDQKSQESQEAASGGLTPLQQVVLPIAPQSEQDVSQGQFLQLPRMVQVSHQQQGPTLMHLSSASYPQLIQLSTLPVSAVTSVACVEPQSTLLTLSSVTTLASTASVAPQQAVHWGREGDADAQICGEGDLWERVVVEGGGQDVGEMMWGGNTERRKENEGIVWEREGERLSQCADVGGDSLI